MTIYKVMHNYFTCLKRAAFSTVLNFNRLLSFVILYYLYDILNYK